MSPRRSTDADLPPSDPSSSVGEIQPQEWAAVADGSTVLTADGQELGTVRESLPSTLHIKAPANLLSDVEMYVPRAWVAAADGTTVRLSRSKAELEEMDLTTPPALR
jgi:hypothetical protein